MFELIKPYKIFYGYTTNIVIDTGCMICATALAMIGFDLILFDVSIYT